MEAVGKQSESSAVVNVKEFLSSWSADVYKECAIDAEDERMHIAENMELTVENVQELENVCSLDHLRCGEEPFDKWKLLEEVPANLDLMMARFQKQELERRVNTQYRSNIYRKMKYKVLDERMMFDPSFDKEKRLRIPPEYQVVYPDVVLTVHVHKPFINVREKGDKGEQLSIVNSFLVLGRQKLTDLRDSIRCVHDLTVAGDLSEDPDSTLQSYAKDIFKSGFIFIENVFYNDMREQDCKDYSKPIIDWSREQGLASYSKALMQDTTFLDLQLRLGHPYLYQHQGDCEHILIFSDLRLITTHDSQDIREYPFLIKKGKKNRVMCKVCQMQAARYYQSVKQFGS